MKTKEKILEVAEEEFAKYGYDAVSMNDLVKKLEINKATIYYHFKDKKALYYEVIKNVMENTHIIISEVFSKDLNGEELFRAYINAMVVSIKNNPNIVPLALREFANYGANIDESLLPYIEEEINHLKLVIEKLDLKDKYKNMNLFTLFSIIQGSIKTFYAVQMSELPIGGQDNLKQNSEKSLDYISEFISTIILDAIVKKEENL